MVCTSSYITPVAIPPAVADQRVHRRLSGRLEIQVTKEEESPLLLTDGEGQENGEDG